MHDCAGPFIDDVSRSSKDVRQIFDHTYGGDCMVKQ